MGSVLARGEQGGGRPVVAVVVGRDDVRDRIVGRLHAAELRPIDLRDRRSLVAYASACALSSLGARLDAIVCEDARVVREIDALLPHVRVVVLRQQSP